MKAHIYLTIILVIFVLLLGWSTDRYKNLAERWHQAYRVSLQLTRQQSATITTLEERQQLVAEMDRKRTKELADAKIQIDTLQHDVASGRKQLQLHVIYPAAMPAVKIPSAASLDDAARARLTNAAERDYYTLRKRIETARQQIDGLQEYIRQHCLN